MEILDDKLFLDYLEHLDSMNGDEKNKIIMDLSEKYKISINKTTELLHISRDLISYRMRVDMFNSISKEAIELFKTKNVTIINKDMVAHKEKELKFILSSI